jgi:hypothetical protein
MGKTGTELQALKEELKLNVKSMLLASKDGMTERELKRDYEADFNRELPYAELGYNSLYDLMRDWHDDVSIRRRYDGVWVYYGIHDANTAHIGRLVEGQVDQKRSVRERQRTLEGQRRQNFNSATGFRSHSTNSNSSSITPLSNTYISTHNNRFFTSRFYQGDHGKKIFK